MKITIRLRSPILTLITTDNQQLDITLLYFFDFRCINVKHRDGFLKFRDLHALFLSLSSQNSSYLKGGGFLFPRFRFARRYVYLKGGSRRRWVQVHASRRSDLFEQALCVQTRRGCENVGVGVYVGGVPGALWRVEPRPLCRRRRASERAEEREGEEGWQRASPGGCVETPARTVVTPKSRPHPVWTPTPTLAQSSRRDHRDLPAGIFVINGFWAPPTRLQQPGRCSRSPPWGERM